MASMSALSEFPELVQQVFVTKNVNSAGIYAIRFFIRGKPWIITVDDEFAFKNDELEFSDIGEN
jgi:hypothetical protein